MFFPYLSTTSLKMAYTGKSSDGWLLTNSMSILLLRGSRRAVPIAMSVAGRKYHYPFYWSSHIFTATEYSNPGIVNSYLLKVLFAPATLERTYLMNVYANVKVQRIDICTPFIFLMGVKINASSSGRHLKRQNISVILNFLKMRNEFLSYYFKYCIATEISDKQRLYKYS